MGGHGDVDWEDCIRMLNSIGYTGPISVEWEDAGMSRDEGAPASLVHLRALDFDVPAQRFDSVFGKSTSVHRARWSVSSPRWFHFGTEKQDVLEIVQVQNLQVEPLYARVPPPSQGVDDFCDLPCYTESLQFLDSSAEERCPPIDLSLRSTHAHHLGGRVRKRVRVSADSVARRANSIKLCHGCREVRVSDVEFVAANWAASFGVFDRPDLQG